MALLAGQEAAAVRPFTFQRGTERGHSCPQQRGVTGAHRKYLESSSARTLLRTGMSALRRQWDLALGIWNCLRRMLADLRPLLVAIFFSFVAGINLRAAEPAREYQVKAAFLFNFAQFADWPPESFEDKDARLVIGIFGADPFGAFLDETVHDEVVRGRRIEIKRCQKIADINACHILFISQSETANLNLILAVLRGKPVLTVSDIPGSGARGVMIQ